jgi:transmembrane sensor
VLISTVATAPAPVVETLAPHDINRLLAWQTRRLVFDALPLSDVVERFNRHRASRGGPRLVLTDRNLGEMRISGHFRADNITTFVELLQQSFGVSVETRGDQILLRGRSPDGGNN